MKYYNKRIYKNYMGDGRVRKHMWNGEHAIGDLVNCNMKDTDDAIISSKQFAKEYAQHLVEIAQRKNKEYIAIGILDANDLIQETNLIFLEAWENLNWNRVKNIPKNEQKAAIWGFLKKSIILKLGTRIREYKDGIKVPDREMFIRADDPRSEKVAEFDAITGMFPQLKLEMMYAEEKAADTSYHNDILIDILMDHMDKYIGIGSRDRLILEYSLGINGSDVSMHDLADKFNMEYEAVKKARQRAIKKLKSEDSLRELAFTIDGACIPTGSNILSYLESI